MGETALHPTAAAIATRIDLLRSNLEELSLRIHANPEVAWQEHKAVNFLTQALEREGFHVERNLCGLETAFRATFSLGPGGPTIAFLAEYDALPEIGHACGHNLICTASVGAAIALRQVLSGQQVAGRVMVIGTPAEEGGGGKIILLERGAFEGVDAAMMFHPGARTMAVRGALAATRLTMRFYGKSAHAASNPHLGINALDACIQTYNAINAMRQHFRDETRIHGIITKGGAAVNVVPDYAEAEFSVRHRSIEYLKTVKEKVMDCARGAAISVGARVEFEEGLTYAERKNNRTMAYRFGSYLEALGEKVEDPPKVGGVGSSDFGNVSHRRFAGGLTPEELGRVHTMRTTAGKEFQHPLYEMILHVLNHGTYHRGQVVTMLRQVGAPAPSTDLIRYRRIRSGQG